MPKPNDLSWQMDRTTISVGTLHDSSNDLAFWLAKPPAARWQAVEYLRYLNYGQAAITGRLQRVLEVVTLQSY